MVAVYLSGKRDRAAFKVDKFGVAERISAAFLMSFPYRRFQETRGGEMDGFTEIIKSIDDVVWGVPLIVVILAVGIYFTVRLIFLQVRHLPKALKFMVKNEEGGKGEVSSFGALCTALSATIGTGNIVGVATAICTGGPGALLWMWLAAFFGMATKFAEGLLSIKYRSIDEKGHVLGGPFYYIEKGMGHKWKWMAKLFAVFGVCVGLFGIGTFTQINSISSAVSSFFDPSYAHTVTIFGVQHTIAEIVAGIIVTLLAALVIIGGIKRIAKVSQVVVPFMAVLYFVVCLSVLLFNVTAIPKAIGEVVVGAFNPKAISGGLIGSFIIAMQKGIARGIFSNEAGLGSAPIASSAARTKSPVRQGLVSMTGTFIDTIVICTMTGLCIVITGAWNIGLEGVAVTNYAFGIGLPIPTAVTSFVLMICLVVFAFTTILGWNYYSERCLEYLTNGKKIALKIFRYVYILAIFIGPYMTIEAVWGIADIFNGLMALPNLVALLFLSGVVVRETNRFFEQFPSKRRLRKLGKTREEYDAEYMRKYGGENEDLSVEVARQADSFHSKE